MDPKKRRKHKARSGGLCQQRMITNDVRQVVTSITAITANPANIEKTDKFQRRIILKNVEGVGRTATIKTLLKMLTRCISHVFYVSKSDGYCNAEDHQHPIDLGYVYLTMNLVRGVNNLDPRKTTK